MKFVLSHIEEVKKKPHHVRKQVAMASAAAGTALIAVVWLAGNLASGTFAINDGSFNDVGAVPEQVSGRASDGIAGAAAVLPEINEPARIEIVTTSASTSRAKAEPTTIPF